VGADVAGGVAVSLVVDTLNGISLPAAGVTENTPAVQLSISARAVNPHP